MYMYIYIYINMYVFDIYIHMYTPIHIHPYVFILPTVGRRRLLDTTLRRDVAGRTRGCKEFEGHRPPPADSSQSLVSASRLSV